MLIDKTYAQLNIVQTYVGDHKVLTYGFKYTMSRFNIVKTYVGQFNLRLVQTYDDNHDVLWSDNLVHVKTHIKRTMLIRKMLSCSNTSKIINNYATIVLTPAIITC